MSITLASRLVDAQNCLRTAWETRSHADIDIAVTKWESILRQAAGDDERYDEILSSYASSLLLRWRWRHRTEDIDNAIEMLEKSVLLQGNEAILARYENHCSLGVAYLDRWEALEREPSDLLNAAAKWEVAHSIALQIGRDTQSARAILPNLGDVYCFAYERKISGISVVSRAIEHYSDALLVANSESATKLRFKLGKAHAMMALKTHEEENLRLAYSYLQQTIASGLSNQEKEDAAIQLGDIYLHEYEQRMTREPLDSAVYWVRRAVHSRDNEGSPRLLRKIASFLTLLYKGFRDTAALDSAIVCFEQAWDLLGSHETEDAATFYYNYGTALMRRSSAGYTGRQRTKDDLELAIELLQLAVDIPDLGPSFAYQMQLQTAHEAYKYFESSPSMRASSLSGDSSAFITPVRSSTLPSLLRHQQQATSTRMQPISSLLGSRSSSNVESRDIPSSDQQLITQGGNIPGMAEAQLSDPPGVAGGLMGWRPATRHQTLPYQHSGLGDTYWGSAQSDVQVWTGRILPSPNENPGNDTLGSPSHNVTIKHTPVSGSSPGADPTYLSPEKLPPSPPIRFKPIGGTSQAVSTPNSPTGSLRVRFDSLSASDPPTSAIPESHSSSSAYAEAVLSSSEDPPVPTLVFGDASSQNVVLLSDAPPDGAFPGTENVPQDSVSEASSIKPTNLTGRIIKTDQFPVDEGGFSSIYKGMFGSTKVAIKVIRNLTAVDSATLQKRLRREMDVWWKLDHPNVVPLWGYTDEMGPLPSMISPWYENGNASNYVQKEGLSIEFRLQLLREVSAGLRYLHHFSPPVVHGDLKPGNVLIDNDGVARLCDFGLAHLVVAGVEATFTSTGNAGTIRYAAPELRCPDDDEESVRASTQTDIYSLACIAYEFLYQKQPFADKGSIQTIIAAGYSHIPPARMEMENLSVLGPTAPHYWELFQSCWDENPSRRPDITAFCEHIDLAFLAFTD